MKKKNILLSTLALLGGIAITTPLIVSCSPTYQKGENMEAIKCILIKAPEEEYYYVKLIDKTNKVIFTSEKVATKVAIKDNKLANDVEILNSEGGTVITIPKGTLVEFQ